QVRRDVLEHVDTARHGAVTAFSAGGYVRPNVETTALSNALEAFEPAGLREIPDPDVLPWRGPSIGFLAALDLPFAIQSPHRLARLESERLERDLDFGDPSVVRDARRGVPDAVPVPTQRFAVVRHLAVGPCAGRIHLEEEAVPMVEKRIEDDRDPVV